MTVYVVLAHRDPTAVRRLARVLAPSTVVLHVDAREDAGAYSGDDIHVVPDRTAVNWAGYSTLDAINASMGVALELAGDGEYIVMLSGECFPARPLAEFESHLASVPSRQYCNGGGMLDSRPESLARITRRWLFDAIPCRPDVGGITAWRWRLLKTIAILAPRRRASHWRGMEPVGGSLWFALTRECVADLLDRASSQGVRRMFRNTYGPDELVWHTLLYDSPWVAHTPEGAIVPRGERRTRSYANFHFLSSGRYLDLSDHDDIKASGSYFCRKLRSPESDSLTAVLMRDIHAGLMGEESDQ
ncbi:hypothetical protein DZF92_02075 [Clavibacter michiganensis subsp. insidiosus]|uniref:Peptide O-xylosyltransferase n=1 Tax=Clavibacter michiganensis subsp. insidiosus TaxID=33014 RepID=A0A399SQX7_9MICO|nr:beta-1,6-N-acetylglucosaminyltransferase [Clavibacter michiganensis]AWG00595.1 hypothetical protein BEH62_03160 [Clavibacter michiganensis subsp. insidiosus]OQJ60793.1 hypothetical protein B5P21_13375 [Clavibacter michiganensis subsp. insidiosus]RII88688.1 hypothetical protein DZF92_02075 [Clavibacter michiganensis subsp. insidiosus]RIJ44822.1 hypothetical protein DZF93_01395 [Clavibacter michiganensis subsp. insidiosus]RMC84218.1 hypothetical protein CmiCFBP2404_12335 [Clavibacter michigan